MSFKSPSNLHDRRRLPRAVQDRGVLFPRPVHAQHRDEIALGRRKPIRFALLSRGLVLEIGVNDPSALKAGLLRMLTVNLFSALGTNHQPWSISYIVIDQNPLTGGVWPLAKVRVYLLAPESRRPVLSTSV